MTEEVPKVNVHLSQDINIPLQQYVDQRFNESNRAADFRVKFAEEILERVEKRAEFEYAKFDGLMPRDTFNVYVGRMMNDFNNVHEEAKHLNEKITNIHEDLKEDISKIELRIVGKEIFTAYVQRAADDLSKAKEEIQEATELAVSVREAATKALADSSLANTQTDNARFEEINARIISARTATSEEIKEATKHPWHLWLMAAGVAVGILTALSSGFYSFVLLPMQAKDTALEQRITTLETQNSKNIDRNYDAIQQTIKAQQTILDRLGRK